MTGKIPPAQPPPADCPPPRRRPHPHRFLWQWRPNPLRRPSDRLQAWITLVLALAVLVLTPAATHAAAQAARDHYRALAQQQALTRTEQSATLTHDAPRHPEPGSDEAQEARYTVPVRYADADGNIRTGRADVQPGLPAGRTVRVWTDPHGKLAPPPLTTEQVRNHTLGWALLTFLAVPLTGLAAHKVTGRLIHQHNLNQWHTAWVHTARHENPRHP
ncbi:hypothetical protein ABZY90_17545 [Streptomyces sp. NPDC006422]|uniref:Rv1733c family protein n=1 Tax=unclassified Streptomyces TaxID=2593676 RepID=UPI0033B598A8